MSFRRLAQIDPSILVSRRGGEKRATGVCMSYMTVANEDANKAENQKTKGIMRMHRAISVPILSCCHLPTSLGVCTWDTDFSRHSWMRLFVITVCWVIILCGSPAQIMRVFPHKWWWKGN